LKIVFYKKSNNREPVKEDLSKLPVDERAKAYERLSSIQKYGFECSRVTFKPIQGKLWEIKYKFKNQHRILYCMQDNKTMVLLHYVKKKTQKLDTQEKDTAEKRMMEVLQNDE
tara:strand:- start:988 stop:1326 length:339 start_codon:yes stop_codon:yes gene_type:complete